MAGSEIPVLQGERVVLRPVRGDDLAPLLAMLLEPDVARWFGRWDAARVQRDLLDPRTTRWCWRSRWTTRSAVC